MLCGNYESEEDTHNDDHVSIPSTSGMNDETDEPMQRMSLPRQTVMTDQTE